MAQLRRLVVVLSGPVNPVRCDARVRVGLAEREEVDPRLERANVLRRAVGEGPVRVTRPKVSRVFPIGPKPCASAARGGRSLSGCLRRLSLIDFCPSPIVNGLIALLGDSG